MERPSEEITVSIAEAVSDALGTPIENLPPLSRSVSLDGLDRVVTDDRAGDVAITFSYAGLRVFVHSDDVVYVRPLRDGEGDPRGGRPVGRR